LSVYMRCSCHKRRDATWIVVCLFVCLLARRVKGKVNDTRERVRRERMKDGKQ